MPKARSEYKKRRRFRGNRYTRSEKNEEDNMATSTRESMSSDDDVNKNVASTPEQPTASARKIVSAELEGPQKADSEPQGFRLIDLSILSTIFKILPCKNCKQFTIELSENISKRKGCASSLELQCHSCDWKEEFYTSHKVNYFFEVNRRLVYAMRSIGCGASGAERFCGLMNMPPIPGSSPYAAHNKALLKAAKEVCEESMGEAAKEIHTLQGKAENDVADCGVSCDGTWQRRGFSSLNGCVTAISIDTGKVVDAEVLTKFCKQCKRHEDDEDTPENIAWRADHQSKCKANFRGSAPAMEPEGALRIFKRSVTNNKLRYTEYFGDGDSKSHAVVKDIYNNGTDGVPVLKKECVGHVQKRVGTALRKFRKENKGTGGRGKLTDATIDKLQNYYGLAVRSNPGDLDGMKKAILASLFHCASSETNKWHHYCPAGETSWCGFMQDKAKGTNNYKPGKGLPLPVVTAIKPIYSRLSADELLKKCLDCKTQNQNESLNGMIWNRLPKQIFIHADVLHLGVYDAISNFNIGSSAAVKTLLKMGITVGVHCLAWSSLTDKHRISTAAIKSAEKTKRRRKIVRAKRKAKGDKQDKDEGKTYACGEF